MGQQLALFQPPDTHEPTTWGEKQVAAVYEYLKEHPITDHIRNGENIFAVIPGSGRVHLELRGFSGLSVSVHPHALGQLCYWLRLPKKYLLGLLKPGEEANWSRELAATNLNQLLHNRVSDKKFLLRTVVGELRGMVSDSYKRFDSPKMIDVFSKECLEHGARPHGGFVTDLRVVVQGSLPQTYERDKQELVVGVQLNHSDFGVGPLEVRFFLSVSGRPMVGRKGIRRIHRGRKLDEDMLINDATMGMDSESAAATIKKLIDVHFDKENINAVMAEIEMADSIALSPDKVTEILEMLKLSSEEKTRAESVFEYDPGHLPQNRTLYRLANVVAWLANEAENPARKLDLMEAAGGLIMKERA